MIENNVFIVSMIFNSFSYYIHGSTKTIISFYLNHHYFYLNFMNIILKIIHDIY